MSRRHSQSSEYLKSVKRNNWYLMSIVELIIDAIIAAIIDESRNTYSETITQKLHLSGFTFSHLMGFSPSVIDIVDLVVICYNFDWYIYDMYIMMMAWQSINRVHLLSVSVVPLCELPSFSITLERYLPSPKSWPVPKICSAGVKIVLQPILYEVSLVQPKHAWTFVHRTLSEHLIHRNRTPTRKDVLDVHVLVASALWSSKSFYADAEDLPACTVSDRYEIVKDAFHKLMTDFNTARLKRKFFVINSFAWAFPGLNCSAALVSSSILLAFARARYFQFLTLMMVVGLKLMQSVTYYLRIQKRIENLYSNRPTGDRT